MTVAAAAGPGSRPGPGAAVRDLRMAVVGTSAWAGTLLGLGAADSARAPAQIGAWLALAGSSGLAAAWVLRHRPRSPFAGGGVPRRAALLLWLCVLSLHAGLAGVRAHDATHGTIADLAERRASVTALAQVTSDPRVRPGSFSDVLLYRATVTAVTRPTAVRTRSPVLVLADPEDDRPAWGTTVRLSGRLAPSEDTDLAGMLVAHRTETVAGPHAVHRAAGHVRSSIREAAGGPSPGDRLVPALVDGDDAHLPESVVTDFRRAGLTHLTAVSGANLTILLAVLLPTARWAGARGRGVLLVAAIGVVAFVLVARPEPSVLRAAVMGSVALVGLGLGGRGVGLRALGAAVLGLLLVSPHLATSWGFALSVCATAGILLVAPGVSRALSRHLPGPLADAVAVPLAAQLACTPLVAALSDEVSLVAVPANVLAAPLVAPTTVLGLLAGLLGLLWQPLGWLPGELAGWCAHGIVLVGRHSADLPGASVPWSGEAWPLALLSLVCLVAAAAAGRLAGARWVVGAVAVAMVAVLLLPGSRLGGLPLPGEGWPPRDWLLVMCDVGQGDALALRSGPDSAVVIDAGPDPAVTDRCLDRLAVSDVPAVVLTHFHQDHVAGLPGVLAGRAVSQVQVSPVAEPAEGAELVRRTAQEAQVPVRVPTLGESTVSGDLRWQVVGPVSAPSDSPNDASLVLLAEVGGVRFLLTGDVEPPGQMLLEARWELPEVDVVKVPHHGSRYQDADWLTNLGASVALVSAGQDNDYGHPAPQTLDLLDRAGVTVWRTDRHGDVALVPTREGLGVVLG